MLISPCNRFITERKTQVENIYILASKGLSFTSKVIKWYQFGFPYTHIAYVLSLDIKNNPIVIEAWLPKVRKGRFSEAHTSGTPFTIFSLTVSKQQKMMIEDFLLSQVGKPYDLFGLLVFLVRRKFIANNGKWFCSELVYTALTRVGIDLLKFTIPQEVSPALFLKSPCLKYEYSAICP
jgi:uncharacterized protein YycO